MLVNPKNEPVAIIGIGCHLPGGIQSTEDLWELLINKKDAIVDVHEDRWNNRLFFDPDNEKMGKTYIYQGGFLKEDITLFDTLFFGISPRETPNIDPQQRLLLEVTYEATEDAGLQLESLRGKNIGVFIGGFFLDFMLMQLSPLNRSRVNMHTPTGYSMGTLSNRLSYTFDFRGPSLTIDTACSSSLVAIHYACQSIWNHESSMAIAGGCHVMLRPESFIMLAKGNYLSKHGRCKAFDEDAAGYVRGEGAAVVILKSYEQALEDNDPIYALIRASGVNQDGQTPAISMPNSYSQEALIRQVYKAGGIDTENIHYVEAHGTGTQAGDPAEMRAINAVLAERKNNNVKVPIGSIKTNLGHMEAVAGVGGLIKAALCLKHKKVPPNLHFSTPNPKLDYEQLCMRVPTEVEDLPKDCISYSAVNSFGFGGTNAHVVLQEVPPRQNIHPLHAPSDKCLHILPLSARSNEALRDLAQKYAHYIQKGECNLKDLLYSAAKRRTHHHTRLSIIAESTKKMVELLSSFGKGEIYKGIISNQILGNTPSKIAFIFTGMGPQWWGMGRELMEKESLFHETLKVCDDIFQGHAGWSMMEELLKDEQSSRMMETQIAQVANFFIQVALTELYKKYGIFADGIVGHSVGEVTAMYVSGALCLEDALLVSLHRSRLQQTLAGKGKLLAVGLSEDDAVNLLELYPNNSIAAINSPNSVTIAGREEDLEEMARLLQAKEIFNKMLRVEIPYHSSFMDVIKDELFESLKGLQPKSIKIPLYSTVTGKQIQGTAGDASYWWHNVRQPVRFTHAINSMIEAGYRLFLEVGPHPVLGNSIKECLHASGNNGITLHSLKRKEPELFTFYETLGTLHTLGITLNWDHFTSGGTYMKLPCYPWQKDRYPFNETEVSLQDRLGLPGHPFLNKKLQIPYDAYEVDLTPSLFPFLTEHRVRNMPVFPGAGYIEGGLALFMREEEGNCTCSLENITLHTMLIIEESKVQRLHLRFDAKTRDYTIYSKVEEDGAEWIQHASGRILPESFTLTNNSLPCVTELKKRCPESLDVKHFYQKLEMLGLRYFPFFRTVKELYKGEGELLARIEGHDSLSSASDDYFLHPTILDGGIQTLAALSPHLMIPAKIGQVNFFRSAGTSCWSYLRINNNTETSIEGNLYLLDDKGQILAELKELECQRVPENKEEKDAIRDTLLYDIVWEESAGPASAEIPCQWLIFAQECDETEKLINHLISRALPYTLVLNGAYDNKIDNFEKMSEVISNLQEKLFTHIVIWEGSQGVHTIGEVSEIIDQSMFILHLVQAWIKIRKEENITLCMISHNAQIIVNQDQGDNLSAGSLWNLGRLISNEHDTIRCKGVDLEREVGEDAITQVVNELLSDNDDHNVAFRSGRRFVQRLLHTSIHKEIDNERIRGIKTDSTYLITGGTRGLGLEIAKWLSSQGADHLVLLSRTGAKTPEIKNALTYMEKQGTNIVATAVDISDDESVHNVIKQIKDTMPPLRGIFHCAMVLDDGFIIDMERERFSRVIMPKVAGALNLHYHTKDYPLDFFISFSSIASIIGNPGQVNYIVANSFLESFAHFRKAHGLAGTTLNLGVLSDVGVASRSSNVQSLLEKSGLRGITADQVLHALELIIHHGPPQIGLFDIDWKVWIQHNPGVAKSSLFTKIITTNKVQENNSNRLQTHLDCMAAMDAHERMSYIQMIVSEELARVLRLPVDKISKKRSIMDQGVDSLLMVELRNLLNEKLGVSLSSTTLFNYPTIEKATEYFLKNIFKIEKRERDIQEDSQTLKDFESLLAKVSEER
ncbi:MAG: type I polyketide synthase [bacterium]